MKKAVLYAAILTLVLVLVVGIRTCMRPAVRKMPGYEKTGKQRISKRVFGRPGTRKVKGEIDIRNAVIEVADEVGKAVVSISTERTQKIGIPRSPFRSRKFRSPFSDKQDSLERFFEDFFGRFPEQEFRQKGLGSGFIIDNRGHILTNYHVVKDADKINITLSDGRTFDATVKGVDPRSDLAIVRISAKKLPIARLGDSSLIQTGEWVVALGNPFGHIIKSPEPTVTVGVVSALHRRIPMPAGEMGYLDMIQTDAAINPGNSGGPLCDLKGNVIGINVAIFSTSGGYQGVGFAIPVNVAKDILGDLVKGKEIKYGWVGVGVQEITPEIASYFNLPDKSGALISKIMPNSPAAAAGLKEGDIIRSFKGKKIVKTDDLLKLVRKTKVGEIVRIGIIRDRVNNLIEVKIANKPSPGSSREARERKASEKSRVWRGIKVLDITDDIALDLGLKEKNGVVIVESEPMSPSYEAGLCEGDVIREINRTRIKNLAGYQKITGEAKGIALIRTDRGYFTVPENDKKQNR